MPKFSMPKSDAIEKVRRKNRADFDADENLRLALAYLIQIIGEAASRMRHKIVHDYLGVDYDIMWEVVTADLPTVTGRLEQIE